MKTIKVQLIAAIIVSMFSVTFAQEADSTGYAGDHFSLEGTIELFKKSKSPEDFEKLLNSDENYVNNLDLNEDGKVDYIRVIDNKEGDLHAIVLQVPINDKESQDIAVIEIEQTDKDNAILQIVGDEDVYGEAIIVEPYEVEEQGGKGGPSVGMEAVKIVVNVSLWPCVRYVYRPSYVVYRSPWYWGYYPSYWRPWRPHPWRYVHTKRVVYRPSCRVVTTHRVVRAHKVYTPVRRSSVTVKTKTTKVRTTKGVATKKTTKVTKTGAAGGKVTKTKTSTAVSGKTATGAKATKTKTSKAVKAQSASGKTVGAKKTKTTAKASNSKGKVKKTKTSKAAGVKGNKRAAGVKKTKTKKVKKKR
jgi:hypothetical protein